MRRLNAQQEDLLQQPPPEWFLAGFFKYDPPSKAGSRQVEEVLRSDAEEFLP